MNEIELGAFGEDLDREHRSKDLLQPQMLPRLGRDVHLQKLIVGATLHLDQIGHLGDFGNSPEILADALTTHERLVHLCPSKTQRIACRTFDGHGYEAGPRARPTAPHPPRGTPTN